MENKTSKYFKYAIGEIVLVVIGILIALQINTWNEERLESQKLKRVLKSIKSDLIQDIIKIKSELAVANEEVQIISNIYARVNNDIMNLDSLVHIAKQEFSYYWVAHFKYTNDSYSSIKSSGFIEKIPDPLQFKLINYYANQSYYENLIENINNQYRDRFDEFTKTYSPIISGLIKTKKYNYLNGINWVDVNPKHFNPRFNTLVNAKRVLWVNYLDELKQMNQQSNELLLELKTYLDD